MKNEIIVLDEKSIKDKIYTIRGQKVMLDSELAEIYGYETKNFNRQVKNNIEKFDEDFMFQLTKEEYENLRCKKFTSSYEDTWGGTRYLPYVFTESGVYMLMTVLKGELAIKQSKALIRIFKGMKDYIIDNNNLLDYEKIINLSFKVIDNTKLLENHDNDIKLIKNEMKNINKLLNNNIMKEMLILNGKQVEAMIAYNKIYNLAKKKIYIIDNYISLKTLLMFKNLSNKIEIVIFSDNVNKTLTKIEYDEFIKEYPLNIVFKKTDNKIHDRYIIIDYGSRNEKIYHSGSSSKDAGKKTTSINEVKDIKLYEELIKDILNNDELILK